MEQIVFLKTTATNQRIEIHEPGGQQSIRMIEVTVDEARDLVIQLQEAINEAATRR